MNRKIKNTLILLGILVFILIAGGAYSYIFQKSRIKKKTEQKINLERTKTDAASLLMQLETVKVREKQLDSVLSRRKFIIPKLLTQTDFYNFVNRISQGSSQLSHIDIEFIDKKQDKNFNIYSYKVSGAAQFSDLFRLIYSIEESKELKKVSNLSLSTAILLDDRSVPHYLVNFTFTALVYFSGDDRFSTSQFVENKLEPGRVYDIFYPIIRNELPPNLEDLPDVGSSKLLAIVTDGAFIADSKGNTFMLMEGDPVYLGYLTKIDYENNQVTFILNKGGIIEKITLKLEKEDKGKKK